MQDCQKEIESEKQRFADNYKGALPDEFYEDFVMFRSLKRTINSYCKNPDRNKIHSICNKIIILRRVYLDEFLYPEILAIGCGDLYKTSFLKYIMNEVFCTHYRIKELDEKWEEDLLTLQSEKKIMKQPRILLRNEATVYLLYLKNLGI